MFKDMNWKPVSAEFLGTFFLVFFGVTSFISMNGNEMLLEGAITLGLTLFVLVHILGPVIICLYKFSQTVPNLAFHFFCINYYSFIHCRFPN